MSNNTVELEKATRDLILSVVDILSAGGQPYMEAAESLSGLLKSAPLLDPKNISRHAFQLGDQREAISREMGRLLEGGRTMPGGEASPRVKLNDDGLPIEVSALLISLINHVVSLRPNYYQDTVDTLIKQVETGSELRAILSGFLELIVQIREDMWEERSKAFKHIEDILRILEATEKDFINSINSSQSYIIKNDQDFTAALESGLMDIGTLVTPASNCLDSLEILCLKISERVAHLHNCVQLKKKADQDRVTALDSEKKKAEKRLNKSKRDYDDFLQQSHEMLKEIEALKAVSLHDPLTEVYNRRAYDNQLPKTLAAYKSRSLKTCSMIVFDIDNFREFNNTYGHLAGDRVLAYVARLTRESLRGDDLIFRYGGDEFVILMPNAPLDASMVVAEKVRRNIASVEFKLFKNSDVTVRVTVSMGVAEINIEDDASSFFARADQAMFLSKSRGRNRVTSQ